MELRLGRRLSTGLLAGVVLATGAAQAVTIVHAPVDLPDLLPGQDLWRYDYQVSGSFEAFGGFNLIFDPSGYAALSDIQPVASADWDAFAVQPDPALPAPGLLTATRLSTGSALGDPFTVQFVWLGTGSPASQPFEVFNDSFDIIETGFTVAVPEPQTYALWAAGLLALAVRRGRR